MSEKKDILENLLASLPHGVVACDVDGNITVFNKLAEEISGYSADEMVGGPVARLYNDSQEQQNIDHLLRESARGRVSKHNTFLKGKGGESIPVRLFATWLHGPSGETAGSLLYFDDVSFAWEGEWRLELLLWINNIVARADTLEAGLQNLAETIVTLVGSSFCFVLTLDESETSLEVKAAAFAPRSGPPGHRWIPNLGQLIRVNDYTGLSELLHSAESRAIDPKKETSRLLLSRLTDALRLAEEIKLLLAVPLRTTASQAVGLLMVGEARSAERAPLTREKVDFANAIAAQTSILIERGRQQQITERRKFEIDALQLYANQAAIAYDSARRMEMLIHMRRTAEALAGATAVDDVLAHIADSARAVLKGHSAALWRYDSTRERFLREGYAASNIPDELINDFLESEPQPGGTAYTVMRLGRLVVEDVTDEERYPFLGASTRAMLVRLGVRSFIGLPLVMGDEPLGVLYVNFNRPRDLGEEELHATLTFASHAAVALKQATLAEEKSRAFELLSKAQDRARVVAQVTALGEPRDSLRSVVTGTKEALGCDAVILYTYDDDRKEFDYPPEMTGVLSPKEATESGTVAETSIVRVVLGLDSLYVAKDTANDALLGKAFARREGIASSVATRLTVRGRPVGVMFVNFREPHEFTEHELTSIDLFAKQAAVAIRNKQLYEQQVRRAAELQALYEAGRSITSSLDLNEILERIAEQAWRLASSRRSNAVFVDIKLLDGMRVRSVASYPPEGAKEVLKDPGREVDLEDGSGGRIGIIGRAIRDRVPQRVGNVFEDPDYLGLNEETRSQIVVLIEKGNKLIGVISAEHPDLNAFDDETLRAMESLAAQAGIAIENARQFEELKRTKGMVGSRSALAWMGMASSVWRHAVEGMAINVKNAAALLRRDLEIGPTPDTLTRAVERITMIERNAEQILQKPITSALSDEGAYSVKVNDLVRARMVRLWQSEPYKSVELVLELSLEDDATVRASAEWLRRALDVLIDNAVRAASEAEVRRITVATLHSGPNAEIVVSDTGHGIPEEVSAQLFNSPVRKPPSAKGLGMGLLMAEAIVQTYGGALRVKHTSSSGTAMVIELPLEEASAAPRLGTQVLTR